MCQRHSFAVTKGGRVIDGHGLTDSHTKMLDMAGLAAKDHDAVNLYEWQPPKDWPKSSWLQGLTVDKQVFKPKSSHDKAARAHLLALYPSMKAWGAGDTIRWGELELPDAERVHRAYDLALRAAPIAPVSDADVSYAVDEHLRRLELDVRVTEIIDLDSVWDSVRASVWDSVRAGVRDSVWASVWDSVRASVWAGVWDSVRASVWAGVRASVWDSVWASVWDSVWASVDSAFVREDDVNAFLPLAELATKGAYLYGITNEGICYIIRGK